MVLSPTGYHVFPARRDGRNRLVQARSRPENCYASLEGILYLVRMIDSGTGPNPAEHFLLAARYLAERTYLLCDSNSRRIGHLLRLSDSVWQDTSQIRHRLPKGCTDGFPLEQLRLYGFVDQRVVRCWRNACTMKGAACPSSWKGNEAVNVLDSLTLEFRIAAEGGNQPTGRWSHMQNSTVALHAAWLRQYVDVPETSPDSWLIL